MVSLADLLAGAPAAMLGLPIGPPGLDLRIGVDGLSGLFLLLLFIVGTGSCAFASGADGNGEPPAAALLAALLAGLAFALLATEMAALVIGFGFAALASWGLLLTGHGEADRRRAGGLDITVSAFALASLVLALGLLAPSPRDLGFAAMRSAPPEGWRASLVLTLVLVGPGGRAGLAPLHAWAPVVHSAAPGPAAAVMAGGMTSLALYLLIRVLFDLCGPAQPMWWAIPLVMLGGASALPGLIRANMARELDTILAADGVGNAGLVVAGLGVALAGRAADLPTLAALALGAALLLVFTHGLLKPMLILNANTVHRGAGSRAIDRLGGLIHRMPVTAGCVLAGCAGLMALPPGPGFAGFWLLIQSVLACARIGVLWVGWLMALAAAGIALCVALRAAAMLRMFGIAFLGRPRTPRVAAAEEMSGTMRWSAIALGGLAVLVGLLPGIAVGVAAPALSDFVGGDLAGRAGWLVLRATAETPGYVPLAFALLIGVVSWGVLGILRRWGARGERRAPLWDDGFAAPPPWLPFGDPATQYTGRPFARPLEQIVEIAKTAVFRRISPRIPLARLWLAFARRTYRLGRVDAQAGLALTGTLLGLLLALVAMLEAAR